MHDSCSDPDLCDRVSVNWNHLYSAKARVLEPVRKRMAANYSEVADQSNPNRTCLVFSTKPDPIGLSVGFIPARARLAG